MSSGGIANGYQDVVCIIRDMKDPHLEEPEELEAGVQDGSVKKLLFDAKIKRFGK